MSKGMKETRGVAGLERPIVGSSVVVAIQDQVSCDLGEEEVILSLKNGVYYGLNPVGARVWDLIQQPRTVDEVRDTLLERYDVEPQRLERDLLVLLQEMAAEGLVEVRGGSPSKVLEPVGG